MSSSRGRRAFPHRGASSFHEMTMTPRDVRTLVDHVTRTSRTATSTGRLSLIDRTRSLSTPPSTTTGPSQDFSRGSGYSESEIILPCPTRNCPVRSGIRSGVRRSPYVVESEVIETGGDTGCDQRAIYLMDRDNFHVNCLILRELQATCRWCLSGTSAATQQCCYQLSSRKDLQQLAVAGCTSSVCAQK